MALPECARARVHSHNSDRFCAKLSEWSWLRYIVASRPPFGGATNCFGADGARASTLERNVTNHETNIDKFPPKVRFEPHQTNIMQTQRQPEQFEEVEYFRSHIVDLRRLFLNLSEHTILFFFASFYLYIFIFFFSANSIWVKRMERRLCNTSHPRSHVVVYM